MKFIVTIILDDSFFDYCYQNYQMFKLGFNNFIIDLKVVFLRVNDFPVYTLKAQVQVFRYMIIGILPS